MDIFLSWQRDGTSKIDPPQLPTIQSSAYYEHVVFHEVLLETLFLVEKQKKAEIGKSQPLPAQTKDQRKRSQLRHDSFSIDTKPLETQEETTVQSSNKCENLCTMQKHGME